MSEYNQPLRLRINTGAGRPADPSAEQAGAKPPPLPPNWTGNKRESEAPQPKGDAIAQVRSRSSRKLDLPAFVYQTMAGRVLLLLLLGLSGMLLWWSVNRMVPVSQALEKKTREISRLTDEVQELETGWDAQEAAQAEARFQELQGQLFANAEDCVLWQENLALNNEAFDLVVKPSQGESEPVASPFPSKSVAALPVVLEIQPLAGGEAANAESPYRRMLDFMQRLGAEQKRMDLIALSVQGQSNSVSRAQVDLQLWTRDVSVTP